MASMRVRGLSALLACVAGPSSALVEIDNFADQRSSTTGKRSALVTYDLKAYTDARLASALDGLFYKAGDYGVRNAAFMFQTCFGGGMIDELRESYSNVDIALGSASRFDQPAWTTNRVSYWTDSMHPALPNSPFVDAFATAYQRNPIGPVAGPQPPRLNSQGVPVTEEAQWTWARDGNAVRLDSATRYHAILWAGQANLKADFSDISAMYDRLTTEWSALGAAYTITVLYGDGAKTFDGVALPTSWRARSATYGNLDIALSEAAAAVDSRTQFVFYATGHGDSLTQIVKQSTTVPNSPGGGGVVELLQGELDALVLDPDNIPLLEFAYEIDGVDPIDVYLGSTLITQLPAGQTRLAVEIGEALLAAGMIGKDLDGSLRTQAQRSGLELSFAIARTSQGRIDEAVLRLGGIAVSAVPEPGTGLCLAAGLGLLLLLRRRGG